MKKSELMQLVGKKVKVIFVKECGGGESTGMLGYTKEFSEKYNYSKPNYFTINYINFKVSHVKKVEVLDGRN